MGGEYGKSGRLPGNGAILAEPWQLASYGYSIRAARIGKSSGQTPAISYNACMPERDHSIEATELYAEAIRLRKIADLLVEKSEIISQRAFSPTDTAIARILEIQDELVSLGWTPPESSN